MVLELTETEYNNWMSWKNRTNTNAVTIPEDKVQSIYKLSDAGYSTNQIAKIVGVSRTTVNNYLRRY